MPHTFLCSHGKEPLDVTESVTWSVEDAGDGYLGVKVIETGPGAGTVTSSTQVGVVKVTATDRAGNSNSSVVTIELLPICGFGVDDTDQTNAKGACLKVASDSAGNWFTSSPSLAVMELLEYTEMDSNTNSGDTYAGTYTATGSDGPIDGVFARFRQDGEGYVNVGDDAGQLYRWCEKLSTLKFGDRTNWRRPTKDELVGLYSDVGGSLWDARGWPTHFAYWSMTTFISDYESDYDVVFLYNGSISRYFPRDGYYASCVSNP